MALILQDGKLGLIDQDGKVVIQPVFEFDKISYELPAPKNPWVFIPSNMDEDIVLIPINGKVGALKITR